MLERHINIFSREVLQQADAICFTSCGVVKSDGTLVMGAGVAKVFRDKYPDLNKELGWRVKNFGNHVHEALVSSGTPLVISFPTKNHWRDKADIALIIQSAKELMEIISRGGWMEKVYLCRPGTGLGGLDWKTQVKPAIQNILDNRVIVVSL